jgi:prevent-host-death family protein
MTTIGVRELRQNASRYLELVAAGESIEVTSHGKPVAMLVPVKDRRPRTREDLIAAGVLIPGSGDLLELEPVELPPGTPSVMELLDEMRGDT